LAFFGNQKKPEKIWLFSVGKVGSGKTLSERHILYKSPLKKSITMQDAQNIERILLLP